MYCCRAAPHNMVYSVRIKMWDSLQSAASVTHYDAELLQGQSHHLIGRIPVADRECLGLIRRRGINTPQVRYAVLR